MSKPSIKQDIRIETDGTILKGHLSVPYKAHGLIIFAHGSGSSHRSPRNRAVANILNEHKLGSLLFDLLTEEEEDIDRKTAQFRFDIPLLTERLTRATLWLQRQSYMDPLPLAYFGASTGAGAAVAAAALLGGDIKAIVARGGRPDLAGEKALHEVRCPTLLIVGGKDTAALALNQRALELMVHTQCKIEVVTGASHLFEEPGTLEQVAAHAVGFLTSTLKPSNTQRREGFTPVPSLGT